jgi:hypothetical protein
MEIDVMNKKNIEKEIDDFFAKISDAELGNFLEETDFEFYNRIDTAVFEFEDSTFECLFWEWQSSTKNRAVFDLVSSDMYYFSEFDDPSNFAEDAADNDVTYALAA